MNVNLLRVRELAKPDQSTLDLVEIILFMMQLVPDALMGKPRALYWSFGLKELQNRADRFLREEMDDFEISSFPPKPNSSARSNSDNGFNRAEINDVNKPVKQKVLRAEKRNNRKPRKSIKQIVKAWLLKKVLWLERVTKSSQRYVYHESDTTFQDENRFKST